MSLRVTLSSGQERERKLLGKAQLGPLRPQKFPAFASCCSLMDPRMRPLNMTEHYYNYAIVPHDDPAVHYTVHL